MSASSHIAVVASLGYKVEPASLPDEFDATLVVEPDNRYFTHAIAVHGPKGKMGYVAPEGARSRFDAIRASATPPTAKVRRAGDDRTAQGAIEFYVDMSAFPLSE
jgi:hypothetical protein